MSRIGKTPVEIPDKVNVELDGNVVKVTGSKGTLSVTLQPSIKIEKQDNKLILTKRDDDRKTRSLYGLSRTLVNNLVVGVSKGFEKELEIQGVGYKAALEGKAMLLKPRNGSVAFLAILLAPNILASTHAVLSAGTITIDISKKSGFGLYTNTLRPSGNTVLRPVLVT